MIKIQRVYSRFYTNFISKETNEFLFVMVIPWGGEEAEQRSEYHLWIIRFHSRAMYFIVSFEPTNERAIFQNDNTSERLTINDLLKWICRRFHFENSSGETGNRRLSLMYNSTELQPHWFLEDIQIQFGATVRCMVKEGKKMFVFWEIFYT